MKDAAVMIESRSMKYIREDINRLRLNLQRTIAHLEYVSMGGEIYLAVDTREIFEYLLPNRETGYNWIPPIGPPHIQEESTLSYAQLLSEQRLALTWLFNGISKPPLVLPPHAEELWAIHDSILGKMTKIRVAVAPVWDTISAEERAYLIRMAPLLRMRLITNPRDIHRLLEIIRKYYTPILGERLDFIYRLSFSNVLAKLDELLLCNRLLFYGPGRKCDYFPDIRVEMDNSLRERISAMITAPRKTHSKPLLNQLRDSQVLALVEELNRKLYDSHKRVLLISRDRSLRAAATAFPESSIGTFLCDVESLFLLAISDITGSRSYSWLNELHALAITLLTALDDIDSYSSTHIKTKIIHLLSRVENLWSEILNQQVALGFNNEDWTVASPVLDTPLGIIEDLDTCGLFISFVLDNASFQKEIRIDTHRALSKLTEAVHRMRSMGHWAMGPVSCFISCASQDQKFVNKLIGDLRTCGLSCWIAWEALQTGSYIAPEIEDAIWTQDKVIIVVSQYSLESQWVAREVEAAFERERKEKKSIIIPIRMDDALDDTRCAWGCDLRRRRIVADFRKWTDDIIYRNVVEMFADTILHNDLD
jgi:hypothetical protein